MKRVLIVDDAIELGRLLQDTIKTIRPEIPVSVVPSAEEALLESSRLNIDLLVTDLRLPGMSGIELIRKIRVRQPNVKVILMTGLSPDDRLSKQKDEAKPDIFLRKPITASDFIDAVDSLIGEQREAEKPAQQPETAKEALLNELAALLPGEPVEQKTRPIAARKATGALAEPVPAPVEEGLSGVLSRLRGSLGAISAILLDERGRIVAQAGDLPEISLDGQLVPPLMAALSASAKITYLLGQVTTQSVQAYRGANMDLMIAPVGQYALLMSLRPGRSSIRLALAFEEALNAQSELAEVLEAMGLRVQAAVEVGAPEAMIAEMSGEKEQQEDIIPPEILETPLGQDPGLEKFEELFSRKQTGQLSLQDPDSFWDQVTTGDRNELNQPGVLSFDQAQKLGLLPEENQE